jgi:hypothetical protein
MNNLQIGLAMVPDLIQMALDKIEAIEAKDQDSPDLDRLYEVLSHLNEQVEIYESERPRREAERKLAYHVENDTLDLY